MTVTDAGRTRWLWWLMACAVCTQTSLNLARPLLSYRAISLGGDALAIGLITSAYALLSLVVAVPLGRLTDRVTRMAWITLTGTVLLAAAPLLMAAAPSLTLVGVAGTVLGFGHIVFMISGQGLIARRSAEQDLDRNFGWFTAAVSSGQMAGPLIAGLVLGEASGAALEGPTVEALVIASVIAVLGLTGVAGLARSSPAPPRGTPRRSKAAAPMPVTALLRRPGVGAGLFVSLALLVSVDLLTAYLPLIAEQRGIAPSVAGVLLGVRAGFSLLSRLLLPWLLARWSRRALVMASALGAAGALGAVTLPANGDPWIMAAALAVGGFLLGIGQPLTMTIVVRAVPGDARSTALALRLWANRIGQVALPAGAGVVAASLGASGALWFACGVLAAAAGAARLAHTP
ncbi:MFS family permease [Spinactinospora alkalitolerans]|uniref:MFS family permease n=1 Tax=Spinactinospora alkalitolerans TaxID=687207 RepID=A0A852U206_9ACTN|nr:MFS transporter [Spinactinospora alkalitolerans]NYE50151.1 MFS family permease [Spinactinospora alkalitolerans]